MLNCDIELVRNIKKSLNVKKKFLINVRSLKNESNNKFNVEVRKKNQTTFNFF